MLVVFESVDCRIFYGDDLVEECINSNIAMSITHYANVWLSQGYSPRWALHLAENQHAKGG